MIILRSLSINIALMCVLVSFATAARIEISAPGEQTIPLAITRLMPLGTGSTSVAVVTEFQQV